MTPEQATLAADILGHHLPSDPDRMADVLAVVAELRAMSAQPCRWHVEGGALHASNPGGRALVLARVPGFARVAGIALASPGEWIEASSTVSRHAIKAQRRALVSRLEQRRLSALADAVQSIRLKDHGAAVLCVYDPDGMPVRVE